MFLSKILETDGKTSKTMFYTDVNDSDNNDQNVSVKMYKSEWAYLFDVTNYEEIRKVAIKGGLRTSRFRSICWNLLLRVLPLDSFKWLTAIEEFRKIYGQIKEKHSNDPHSQDSGPDNPLSLDENSVWKQYFVDNELKNVIRLDVVRTSPGVQFFTTDKIQEIMINILFCYSREHPELCYRQGMHEILAPLLFVIHCDHQALLHVLEQPSSNVSDLIQQILNPAYLEADAYSLFNVIMDRMQDYYNVNDYVLSASEQFERIKITSSSSESEVVRKLSKIRDKMLMKHDPELHGHLLDLDISFTTFGVRWLRLLFGGEFSLMDSLVLWDTIFAKSPHNFELVDHIFVSMLVLLRVQLLKSDNTNCLNFLMRYPHVDVITVIEYALHMSDPKKYILPPVINSLKHDKSHNLKTNIINENDQPERPSTFVSNYSTRRTHTSSDDLLELCRIKILQYHSVLSQVVPSQHREGRLALSGMLELCGLLNPRSGIIEMGKDIVRSTTPIQTPMTPETPEECPLLPPPASAITMKVFRKTENSADSQIQGAPTKNPLKQMKRFYPADSVITSTTDADDVAAASALVELSITKFNKIQCYKPKCETVTSGDLIETATNGDGAVRKEERPDGKNSVELDDNGSAVKFIKMSSDFGSHSRDVTSVKKDAAESAATYYKEPTAWSFQPGRPMSGLRLNVNAIIEPVKTYGPAKQQRTYTRPTCSYPCLIGIAMKYSSSGTIPVNEIHKFACRYFPFFSTTDDLRWKRKIHQHLWTNDFFVTDDARSLKKGLYRLRVPLQEILWRVHLRKVAELDRMVGSWASSNPTANARSMSHPGELAKLMRYRDVPYPNDEVIIIVDDDDDDVEEEEVIVIDDDDDNPFGMVTLTADDVSYYLMANDRPFEERPSSGRTHDGAVYRRMTDVQENRKNENNKPRKKKNEGGRTKDAAKRPMNAFMIFAKTKRRQFAESNPSMPGIEVTRLLGTTWKSMNLKERLPFMREAERLKERHFSEITDGSKPMPSVTATKRVLGGINREKSG